MSAVQLEPLPVPFVDATVKLAGVHWSDDAATTIDVVSRQSGRRARLEFEHVAGLRMLGELDLAGS